MAPQDLELEVPRGRMALRLWGPEDGAPALALHGWMDNAASFDRLAPQLPELRLAALDLPGHGRSSHRPLGMAYHFVDWIADVLDAADALGWETFGLLGHSMGAGIAPLVAAAAPDRVDWLVMVEGLGPLSEDPEALPARLARASREGRGPSRQPSHWPGVDAAVEARLRNSTLTRESARILVERALEPVARGVRFSHDPRLREPSWVRLTEEQVRAVLGSVRCPALVIRADQGLQVDREVFQGRLERLSDREAAVVPGGHHPHLDRPGPVAEAVRDFLARCARRRRNGPER